MRYRATIGVDIWTDTKDEAEKEVEGIILGLPNSLLIALSRLPHGSKISLVEENHDRQV